MPHFVRFFLATFVATIYLFLPSLAAGVHSQPDNIVAAGHTLTTDQGLATTTAPDLPKNAHKIDGAFQPPAMDFFIIRLSKPACEPDCPEWIAAQGRIMPDTDKKLSAILSTPANRKLPLMLNSYGGDIDAALRMGSTLRRYKMTTSVGWTHFDGCSPFMHFDTPCKPDGINNTYAAIADEWGAKCYSACPLILMGGSKRIVNAGSRIGLHAPLAQSYPYVDRYMDTWSLVHGHKVIVSHKFLKRTYLPAKMIVGITPELRRRFISYLHAMGGTAQIMDEMEKASPTQMNIIPDADGSRAKLGLVTIGYGPLAAHAGLAACNVLLIQQPNCIHLKEKELQILQPLIGANHMVSGL